MWLIFWLGAASADTCEVCMTKQGLLLPSDDAVNVGTLAVPVVGFVAGIVFRDATTGDWIDGVLTPFDPKLVFPNAFHAHPDRELPADSRIEVWEINADGVADEVLGRFFTGAGPDTQPPDPPADLRLFPDRCGPFDPTVKVLWGERAPNEDAFYEVHYAHPIRDEFALELSTISILTLDGTCGPTMPDMWPGDVIDIRVRAIDLSGNKSEWTQIEQATLMRGCGCSTAAPTRSWLGRLARRPRATAP